VSGKQKTATEWPVTTKEIAEATGRNRAVVRRDIAKGLLKPWNLLDLAWYVIAFSYVKHRGEEDVEKISRPSEDAGKVAKVARRVVSEPAVLQQDQPPAAPPLEKEPNVKPPNVKPLKVKGVYS